MATDALNERWYNKQGVKSRMYGCKTNTRVIIYARYVVEINGERLGPEFDSELEAEEYSLRKLKELGE